MESNDQMTYDGDFVCHALLTVLNPPHLVLRVHMLSHICSIVRCWAWLQGMYNNHWQWCPAWRTAAVMQRSDTYLGGAQA